MYYCAHFISPFNIAASVLLISGRARYSTVEPIDPRGPKMVILRVIHQTGPRAPAHSSNSFNLECFSRCLGLALYLIQTNFCSMGAVRKLFFYESNLLHHFALLDLFRAVLLSGMGFVFPSQPHSAGCAFSPRALSSFSCPLSSHSLFFCFWHKHMRWLGKYTVHTLYFKAQECPLLSSCYIIVSLRVWGSKWLLFLPKLLWCDSSVSLTQRSTYTGGVASLPLIVSSQSGEEMPGADNVA